MLKRLVLATLLSCLGAAIGACATPSPTAPEAPRIETLARWMTGTFSNAAQSKADPDGYFHIRLVMQPIWPDRSDGVWLYVEQAASDALDRPYRQRVYHVTEVLEDGVPVGYVSEIFTLPGEAKQYLNGWSADSPIHALAPPDLTLRAGCTIYLEDRGDHFAGGTRGTSCSSSLGDAKYATSQVTIHADRVVSWDQGFTAEGEPAWGPEHAGYAFVRTSSAPPRPSR